MQECSGFRRRTGLRLRDDAKHHVPVRLGIVACQLRGANVQPCPRLLERDGGLQPSKHNQHARRSIFEYRLRRHETHEAADHPRWHIGRDTQQRLGAAERARRHANDGERLVAEAHRSSDDGWITAKPRLPVVIGDYDHRRVARRASFIGPNQPSGGRLHAQH